MARPVYGSHAVSLGYTPGKGFLKSAYLNGPEQADCSGNRKIETQRNEAGIQADEGALFTQHQKRDSGDADDHS